MIRTKRNVVLWTLLSVLITVISCLSFGVFSKTVSAKAAEDSYIETDVNKAEAWDNGTTLMLFLTKTDYMTATEWSTDSNEAYKWVEALDYEDRENHNVCNAVLDKNLSSYNFAEKIFIDGIALKNYSYTLVANRYTRVDSLGIVFPTAVLSSAKTITVEKGCQLPSLMHSYFGKEFVCLETQEDLIFTYKNGNWAKGYPFDSYEAEVEYDASERYFYARNAGSSFKGHPETPTPEFTQVFSINGWGDDGYTLASTSDTVEGNLVVAELVHPIDASDFRAVRLRVFSNVERTFAAYNASKIEVGNLGEAVESFTIPGKKFTAITLSSELYADENGQIEQFVFQFMDNGSENTADNQFFFGSFSCLDNYYRLSFPTGVKGELTGNEVVDMEKVFVNGESLSAMNKRGNNVEAKWATKDGYYQIDIKLSRDYTGKGAVKNSDLAYTGNNIKVDAGLALPNGETMDRGYTYRIYKNETFFDYEVIDQYEDICVTDVKVRIDTASANNIRFTISFDKKIIHKMYVHACETEEFRQALPPEKEWYKKEVSEAFVSGGFKASFLDNVLINGRSVGEWHAIDDLPTCVHVHYGQTDLYTMDVYIDSNSEMYKPMYEAFEKGEDITLEVKGGMKFTTATSTTKDYKFIVNGSNVATEQETVPLKVAYDGREVSDGDTIVSATKAMESNIFVQGADRYTVTAATEGNTVRFVLTFANGETLAFSVQENIVNEIPEEKKKGCSSSMTAESAGLVLSGLALFVVFAMRRKHYE